MMKKAFFWVWDNLVLYLPLNAVAIAFIAALCYFPLFFFLPLGLIPFLGYTMLILVAFNVYIVAASDLILRADTSITPFFKEIFPAMKKHLVNGVVLGLFSCCQFLIIAVVIPLYFGLNESWSLIAIVFLISLNVLWGAASAYFSSFAVRNNQGAINAVKDSFLFFFDNIGFTLFSIVVGFVLFFLCSVLIAFMFPGFAGMLTLYACGIKLRMLKYNGKTGRTDWKALLAEEREKVGKRTLKDMFIPSNK